MPGDVFDQAAMEPPKSPYSQPSPYVTQLSPQDEPKFQGWVKQNRIPWQDSPTADYDMRGFWQAQQAGNPIAVRAVNQHFPDVWKTPYHKLFSNESMYATSQAPHWEGDKLVPSASTSSTATSGDVFDQAAAAPSHPPNAPPPTATFNPMHTLSRFAEGVGLPTSREGMHAMAAAATPSWPEIIGGPAVTAGKMLYGLGKNAYEQAGHAKDEIKDAASNIVEGQPVMPNVGKALYATYEGAAKSIPGAAAPFNFGTDVAAKDYGGATGDAVATLAQAMMLRGKGAPKPATQVNKLGYAAGGEVSALEHTLPEIEKTIDLKGGAAPRTVGDLQQTVQDTLSRHEQKFNTALAAAKGQLVPQQISDALEAKARTLPPTAEGQGIAQQLRSAATEYQKPWTPQELNAERMYRNGLTRAFNSKPGSAQMAAMRSNADTMIDETVAREARDVLYNELDRQFPGQQFAAGKQTQSRLIDLKDQLDSQVEKLKDRQAAFKGAPLLEKPGFSASVHPGGVTPRVHLGSFIESAIGRGPMDTANTAVKGALGPRGGVGRAAALALPISHLAQQAQEPPPPQPTPAQ